MTAGFWSEVARAVDPPRSSDRHGPTSAASRTSPTDDATPVEELDLTESTAQAAPPAEGVLVPIDTWTRVMDQLGNLHDAGQQLAEARERAARAETQVEFLREQLAEARTKPKPRSRPAAPATAPKPGVEPDPVESSAVPTVSRLSIGRARNRVSTWLRTD